jgi:hypothetical protein
MIFECMFSLQCTTQTFRSADYDRAEIFSVGRALERQATQEALEPGFRFQHRDGAADFKG